MQDNRTRLVLHGEDDEADVMVVKRILSRLDFPVEYENLEKGDEVVDRVLQTGPFSGRDLVAPSIVLLDIGLPVYNGIEVLQKLRNHDRSRNIPIIMMSGSNSIRDFQSGVQLGANGYIQKTADFKKMSSIFGSLIGAWVQMSDQKFF